MAQIIPIFPCSDADALTAFYTNLGFELVGIFTRSYIVLKREEIEIHFYATKQVKPSENSAMCFIRVENVESFYESLTTSFLAKAGKLPRSGFPKISKIRDLSEDRRFTISDPSGNTLYIGTPKPAGSHSFFRDLQHPDHAALFAMLYDLVYSKEDCKVANNLLPRVMALQDQLEALDQAKLLLVQLEIQKGLHKPLDEAALHALLAAHPADDGAWNRIRAKFGEMLQTE